MSDYIPEGNLVQILKPLPVKTLLRFRCVCKGWKALIDSTTFKLEHLAVQKPRCLLQCKEREYIVVDPLTLPLVQILKSPIEEEDWSFEFIGTHHGVVCLYNLDHGLLLWNPSIRKLSLLRLPDYFARPFYFGSDTCCGFWIDPSTKEFKIIRLLFRRGRYIDSLNLMNGILYSSVQRIWNVIPTTDSHFEHLYTHSTPVMIGGVAHWQGLYNPADKEDEMLQSKAILSFDFSQERFDLIEIPNLKGLAKFGIRVCNWQGTLSLVYWDPMFPYRCDIYSRQQGSWINMFGFNFLAPIADFFWLVEGMEEWGRAVVAVKYYRSRVELVLSDTKAGRIPLYDTMSLQNLKIFKKKYAFI